MKTKLIFAVGGACMITAAAIAAGQSDMGRAPSLPGAPYDVPAPGRGLIPSVSVHTAALPTLYSLSDQPVERISPLISRQYLSGAQSTMVKWTVKAGGSFPLHHHANEQITWIVSGRCDVYSQERRFQASAGTILVIPPNVPHAFECPVDTVDIDFFSPGRQDWADGLPSVAAVKGP